MTGVHGSVGFPCGVVLVALLFGASARGQETDLQRAAAEHRERVERSMAETRARMEAARGESRRRREERAAAKAVAVEREVTESAPTDREPVEPSLEVETPSAPGQVPGAPTTSLGRRLAERAAEAEQSLQQLEQQAEAAHDPGITWVAPGTPRSTLEDLPVDGEHEEELEPSFVRGRTFMQSRAEVDRAEQERRRAEAEAAERAAAGGGEMSGQERVNAGLLWAKRGGLLATLLAAAVGSAVRSRRDRGTAPGGGRSPGS